MEDLLPKGIKLPNERYIVIWLGEKVFEGSYQELTNRFNQQIKMYKTNGLSCDGFELVPLD